MTGEEEKKTLLSRTIIVFEICPSYNFCITSSMNEQYGSVRENVIRK